MRIVIGNEYVGNPQAGDRGTGGCEVIAHSLADALADAGHQVIFVYSDNDCLEASKDADIVHLMNCNVRWSHKQIDTLLNGHTPIVWTLMDYWPICGSRMALKADGNRCSACTEQCDYPACGMEPAPVPKYVEWLRHPNCHPVALSRRQSHILRRHGVPVACVLPPGIDASFWKPDTKVSRSIVTTSAWANVMWKGMHVLHEAAKSTGVTIDCLSGQHRHQIRSALGSAEIAVFPSLYEETFCLAATEARACECVVIGTSVSGLCDQIVHGETGFLVPPNDATALAETLLMVLANEHRRSIGEAARVSVLEEHVIENMVARHEQFYEAIVA